MLFETAAAVGAGLLSGFLSTVYFRWLDKRGKMEIFFRPMWDDVGFTFNDYRGKQYASLPLRLEFFNRSRSSKIVGDFWVFFFNRATGHEFPTMQVRNRGSEEGISSQLDTSRYAEYTYSFSLPATTMREVVLQFDVPSFEKFRDGDIFDIYFGYTNEKGRQRNGACWLQ